MKLLTATVLVALSPAAYADADYQFRVVDFPGAANTFVFALNNFGQFVGAEQDAAGVHRAIFDDGRQLELLDLSGLTSTVTQSRAFSINNRGDIAGAYADATGAQHGYVHHGNGTVTQIDFPGAIDTQAFGVNDLQTVIGLYVDAQGNSRAFEGRDGKYRNVDLPGGLSTLTIPLSINDLQQIAGEYALDPLTNGFGYVQTPDGRFELTTAPGSAPQQTFFISINNRDQILGGFADASGVQHNFLKTGNLYRPFNVPARLGASFVSAQTVNDLDWIVGYYVDASNVAHGFVARR